MPAVLGATLFYIGTTAVTVGTVLQVAVVVASIALNTIFRPKRPKQPQFDISEEQKEIVKQAVPRQRIFYGEGLVGGAICYINKNPPNLVVQYLVANHRCDALESIEVNGRVAVPDDAGTVTNAPFVGVNGSLLRFNARLGDPDQAIDPLLVAQFPSIPTTFRQRGQTVVTTVADYGANNDEHEEVWGSSGSFTPRFRIKGKPLYDPRNGAHDINDDATWEYSNNWALVIADYMMDPNGGRKNSSDIDWDYVKGAANFCDQPVGISGGSEPRYTINGLIDTSQEPLQKLGEMLDAGAGGIAWSGGKFRPVPGGYKAEPVATLTQDDLAGGFTFRSEVPRGDAVNVISAEFLSPERDDQAAQTPVLERADLIASDGERIEITRRLPFVSGNERAQRLNDIFLEGSRLGKRLQIIVGVEWFMLEVGDALNIEFDDFVFANGVYRVERLRDDIHAGLIEIGLAEFNFEQQFGWVASDALPFTITEIVSS